jgi:hypothetical protein
LAAPANRGALSGSKNLFVPKMMYQILTFGRLTTAKMQRFALSVAPPERSNSNGFMERKINSPRSS